jgi:phosphatidylglycerophosphatase C
MSPVPTVAAFDVDGTLTRRDSFVPFLWRFGMLRLATGLCRRPVRLLRALLGRDRDGLKALAVLAVFKGRPFEDVVAAARDHAARLERNGLRPDTVDRLRWHQSEGHVVVFVSASLEVYLHPLAEALGVDAVLGTRLEVDGEGRCTGALVGANCRAEEKVARLDAWLAKTGRADAEVWAYGDSPGDHALLARADHAIDAHRHGLVERGMAA